MENNAQTIVKLGHLAVINIVEAWKDIIKDNGLVYDGPVYDCHFDADGPNYIINKQFEDFLFFNSNLFIEDQKPKKVKIIVLIGDEDESEPRRSKRNISRNREQDRDDKRATRKRRGGLDRGKGEEGDSGSSGVQEDDR
jgi:hypothetical protein